MRFFPPFCLFAFVLLVGLGCGTLRPDPSSISAIEAHRYTAEFSARGERFFGVGMLAINEGEPLSRLNLSVEGYYRGTLRAYSQECNLDITVRYNKSGRIPVTLAGNARGNCAIVFTLSPEFPKETSSAIRIHSIRGMLGIRVKPIKREWYGQAVSVSGNAWTKRINIPAGPVERATVQLFGCGKEYRSDVRVIEGEAEIELQDAVATRDVQVCVLEGRLITDEYQDLLLNFFVSVYDSRLVDQPVPALSFTRYGEIVVRADNSVAITALNNRAVLGNHVLFEADWRKPQVLRLLTVKGRNRIGEWIPSIRSWVWMP